MELKPARSYADVVRVDTKSSHYYRLADGPRVPNVTGVLSAGMPKQLTGWAARMAAQDMYHHMTTHPDPRSGDDLVEWASKAPFRHRDKAGDRGRRVHDYAEQIAFGRTNDIPKELTPWSDGVVGFLNDFDLRPVAVEVVVWSDDPLYAGTLDMLTEDVDGKISCQDWKTSKGVWPDYCLQLAAYKRAKWMRIGDKVYEVPEVGDCGVVHLPGDRTYTYYMLDTGDLAYGAYLAAMKIAEWSKQPKDSVVREWKKDM